MNTCKSTTKGSTPRAAEGVEAYKMSRNKAGKSSSSKTIMDMYAPAANPVDPTKQLEHTLQKHTEMFDKILLANKDSREALEAQIGAVQLETCLLRSDQTKLAERITETESCLSSLHPTVLDAQNQIRDLKAEVQRLQDRAEDAEGRSRRNNVPFLGFSEKSEGPNTELFLEDWLIKEVFQGKVPKLSSVERAHRIPGKPPVQGAPPRPLIARLLNFRDRDLILQLFRTKGTMTYEGHTISAYPDFTTEVQRKRSSYAAVKVSLRKAGLKYALNFPARLRVVEGDDVHFFSNIGGSLAVVAAERSRRSKYGR